MLAGGGGTDAVIVAPSVLVTMGVGASVGTVGLSEQPTPATSARRPAVVNVLIAALVSVWVRG
jgi:hypothetical protein